jgi:hypothetical protein
MRWASTKLSGIAFGPLTGLPVLSQAAYLRSPYIVLPGPARLR